MDVLTTTGRVDVQLPGASEWTALEHHTTLPASSTLRLQKGAQAYLGLGMPSHMEIFGPATLHLMQLPGLEGGKPDLAWNSWSGSVTLSTSDSNLREVRGTCGPLQFRAQKVETRLSCATDSNFFQVEIMQGQATVSRLAEYGITLDAGKIWRAYFDSSWGRDTLFFQSLASSSSDTLPALMRLIWEGPSHTDISTRWDLKTFLSQSVDSLAFTTDSTRTPWTARIRIVEFSVLPGSDFWTLNIQLSCALSRRGSPLENTTQHWERHLQIPNDAANPLELLRLLPLDLHNQRIQASALGSVSQELRQWIQGPILNPFVRSGMVKPTDAPKP